MRNIRLCIAYKGTNYAGWQRQPNALGIETVITEAIRNLTGEQVVIYGSGRTDAGVHALGQCANFHTESSIPDERFAIALNTKLPRDIRVLKSELVEPDFHSRYSAKGKRYLYQIDLSPVESPFYSEFSWHVNWKLDIVQMQKAAANFVGTHDFRAFMASGSHVKDTVRTVRSIDFVEKDSRLQIYFEGNGFLYNMVRIMTGTLVDVGIGKIEPGYIRAIIDSLDRSQAGITAPAQGLFLEKVFY